jgi:hypothetical protein
MPWGFGILFLATVICTLGLPGHTAQTARALEDNNAGKYSASTIGGPALWAQPRNLLESEDEDALRPMPRTLAQGHGSTPEKLTFLNTVTFSRRALLEAFDLANAGAGLQFIVSGSPKAFRANVESL